MMGKAWKTMAIPAAGIAGNVFVGVGKLGLGILSLSLFTCVSALYTFGMVVAKGCALLGVLKSQSRAQQYRYYALSGIILIISSLLYMGYSLRLFIYPATSAYSLYVALAIASFTFFEIAINLRGVLVARHGHDPLIHAIKLLNLASSLICLSLTQAALLSISSQEVGAHPAANGLMGLLCGAGAAALGIFMVVRVHKIQASEPGGTCDDPAFGGGGRRAAEPKRVHASEQ